MSSTSLTVGGFNQPSVACSLIELPGNAEKGLSQRFLWFFPKPVYGEFDSLEMTDKAFTEKAGILSFPHTYIEYVLIKACSNIHLLQSKHWQHCGGKLQGRG